jgi:hypothetical protein
MVPLVLLGGNMAKKRLFYKTVIRYEVLSEEPIPADYSLNDIYSEAYEGRYVGRFLPSGANDHILMNGAAMAEALCEAGSDPGFFCLDALGFDFDENEPERDFDFEKDD